MNYYNTTQIDATNIQFEYHKDGKVVRKLNIKIGVLYKIEPDNKLKKKHRGRKCTVVGFIYDDLNNPMDAKVKFHDTNRTGKVGITDIVEFE